MAFSLKLDRTREHELVEDGQSPSICGRHVVMQARAVGPDMTTMIGCLAGRWLV